jgi:hypothetical protein
MGQISECCNSTFYNSSIIETEPGYYQKQVRCSCGKTLVIEFNCYGQIDSTEIICEPNKVIKIIPPKKP